jgi:hypothetical protein
MQLKGWFLRSLSYYIVRYKGESSQKKENPKDYETA